MRYDSADTKAATDLLTRPRDLVTAFLAVHWTAVLDPSGTVLAPLGVTTKPPTIPAGEGAPQVADPDRP